MLHTVWPWLFLPHLIQYLIQPQKPPSFFRAYVAGMAEFFCQLLMRSSSISFRPGQINFYLPIPGERRRETFGKEQGLNPGLLYKQTIALTP